MRDREREREREREEEEEVVLMENAGDQLAESMESAAVSE